MATTDAWSIRALGPADLPAALALSTGAGWNQVEADWRVFLEAGRLFGADAPGAGLIATAATLPLGRELGWISMMLVDATFRGRGVAKRLLERCLLDLAAQGLAPGLDATPAGLDVYAKFEFRATGTITRLVREGSAVLAPSGPANRPAIRSATPADLDPMAALDQRAFGTERRALLARLLERSHGLAVVALDRGRHAGFALARDGRHAMQVGPVVASGPKIAVALLSHAIAHVQGPVCVDLVDGHEAVQDALAALGLLPQRKFTRMFYRRDKPPGDPKLGIAIAGPELG